MKDCKAMTFAVGGWYCAKCEIGGDQDEPAEEFCKGREDEGAKKDDKPSQRR